MKRGSGEDRPLSKEEEAAFDRLLKEYMPLEDAQEVLREDAIRAPVRLAARTIRPNDDTIYAYLSGAATPEQEAEVHRAMVSESFCRELLASSEDLDRVRSTESAAEFDTLDESVLPEWYYNMLEEVGVTDVHTPVNAPKASWWKRLLGWFAVQKLERPIPRRSGDEIQKDLDPRSADLGAQLRSRVRDPRIGKSVSHFRILEVLGTGSMGEVYRARDLDHDREVALKFLPGVASKSVRERFMHEAKAGTVLDHENIGAVYEVGETEDGHTFIAMAYYGGETLQSRLRRGPLPISEAAEIARQVGSGLQAAHAQGLVHRDVKPSNIMITDRGLAKILDFVEVPKIYAPLLMQAAPGVRTDPFPYMSPEQVMGKASDQRTDVWSLGVVLYEMLTGRLPFWVDSGVETLFRILKKKPRSISKIRPEVPRALRAVVERALSKDPDKRYPSVGEMVSALKPSAPKSRSTPSEKRLPPKQKRPLIFPRRDPAVIMSTGEALWPLEALVQENTKLKRALEELSMLNELWREIGASRNSDVMMNQMAQRILKSLNAGQIVVSVMTEHNEMVTAFGAGTTGEQRAFDLDQNLLSWMYLNKRPLLTNSPESDLHFRNVKLDPEIRSLLCVPLIAHSRLIGLITAYNKKSDEGFSDEDTRLLSIMAMQSAQILENARLYENIREEVRLAAAIQLLLPQEAPKVPGYDVFGTSVPAALAGGDYFDFIPMEGERLGISVGDVSGKGLNASLLMANVQATLRGQTLREILPSETLRRSNRLLFRGTDPEKFATLFFGVLDPKTHTFDFSNAGHQDPFFYSPRTGLRRLVTKSSIALGVVDDFAFQEDRMKIRPGDTLLLFSDGIIEAIDRAQHRFGENRLAALIEKNRDQSAEVLATKVIEGVEEYVGDAPSEDDLTVVVVKRKAA